MSAAQRQALGRLVAVHPISPAHLQRAVLLAVLSLTFFLTMMFAFYLLQGLVYFLLATAFLVIYLVTMYAFFTARKMVVEVFENGLRTGKRTFLLSNVASVDPAGVIHLLDGEKIDIPRSIHERDALIDRIRSSEQ